MKKRGNSVLRRCLLVMMALLLLFSLVACDMVAGEKGEKGAPGEKGDKGDPGTPGTTISIGENGNWYLDGEDTGFSSRGQNGTSISIGENGNWHLDGKDSGVAAQGPSGSTIGIGENGNWFLDGADTGHSSVGPAGASGSVVTIGNNGNWFIDGEDTGRSSVGEKGDVGTVVEIGANGNWFLDGEDTGVPASGAGAASAGVAEATKTLRKSAVAISVRKTDGNGVGSGFIYDTNGHICTNHHVIEGATFVQVILHDGTARKAEIVGYNEDADVAVLKVDPTGLVPATLANSDLLSQGDRVFALGTPTSLSYIATATYGHVSYPLRGFFQEDEDTGAVKKMRLIQTDTPINPGNSGGPLGDAYGRVVGMVTLKLMKNSGGEALENMGFALPINGVKIIVDDIIENGELTVKNPITTPRSVLNISAHGGVGGYWYAEDPENAGQYLQSNAEQSGFHYMEKTGLYVLAASVLSTLREGDIVMEMNGYALLYPSELLTLLNYYDAGDTVDLKVWRDGDEISVEAEVVEELLP